jgi:hypothetical protein
MARWRRRRRGEHFFCSILAGCSLGDGRRRERQLGIASEWTNPLTSSLSLFLLRPAHSVRSSTIYYSTPTFRIPLTCRARLSVIRHAKENKTTLSSLLALVLSALYGKWKLAQRKVEKEKVRELVGRVLGELRKQVSFFFRLLSVLARRRDGFRGRSVRESWPSSN